jgi:glycyl-tRNA synthetase
MIIDFISLVSTLLRLSACRLVLAILSSAYCTDTVGGETRTVLRLHPSIAPIKASILPLVKNNPDIMQLSSELYATLTSSGVYLFDMDVAGAIGRRYRRADEIGTPFCITVDFDSLSDECVTIRHRDTCAQERVSIAGIHSYLSSLIQGSTIGAKQGVSDA